MNGQLLQRNVSIETTSQFSIRTRLKDDYHNSATNNLAEINSKETEVQKAQAIEKNVEDKLLEKSYFIRCLNPETIYSLETIEEPGKTGSVWKALINPCRSQNKQTLHEVHQQLTKHKDVINIKLDSIPGGIKQLRKYWKTLPTSYHTNKCGELSHWGPGCVRKLCKNDKPFFWRISLTSSDRKVTRTYTGISWCYNCAIGA